MCANKGLCVAVLVLYSWLLCGCGSSSSGSNPAAPASPAVSAVWNFSGLHGGFVPNIVFHPSNSCEVWASADDMGGLYRSTDCGSNWNRVTTPRNFSTYSLTFAPNDPSTLYAPSHFGWGMLKSTNGGASWSLFQAGLPSTGLTKHVYQLAIKPSDPTVMLAATESGLYKSTDSGANFTKLNLAWGSLFRTAIFLPTGRLFAGEVNGVVKYSDDSGTTWNDLFTGAGHVSQIAATTNAIYYLFDDGSLVYTTPDFVSGNGTLNVSTTGITSGAVKATMAVVSGANQAGDTLWLGTSRNAVAGSARWGLFKSTNGGASWTQQTSGVAGHSIFSIAVDPGDPQRVLVGTCDSAGIFRTTDGGTTWTGSSPGMLANTGFGVAQNPLNANELVMTSTVGFGLGKTFHSTDLGSNWSIVSEVNPDDGVMTVDFDPVHAGTVLAGMISTGLYRSTTGIDGTWSRVINTDVKIARIVREKTDPAIVYSLAASGVPATDARVYYSNDGGASFTQRSSFFAVDLAPHPSTSKEAVIAALTDVFASTDGFATANSLGMSAQATAQGALTAIEFNPANASEVWVGGLAGGLYRTTNYNSAGTGITWTAVSSPISKAMVRQIMVRTENSVKVVYVSSFAGDVDFTPGAVLGLWRTTDNGATWTELSTSLSPCTSFWSFMPVAGSTTDLWAGLWGGGGLFRLSYQ